MLTAALALLSEVYLKRKSEKMDRNLSGQVGSGEDFISWVSPEPMGWVWSQAGMPVWNVIAVRAGWFVSALRSKALSTC